MGNPAAKELIGSVTKGVVSGNREFAGRKLIQTDAAANPGSSGGPLLDKSGRVIGLISWKFAGAEYQGLAFAVPIREALARLNITMSPSP
jgi:S1-C subfamily serine protease